MRAVALSELKTGEVSIEVFDVVEPTERGAEKRDGSGAGPVRLWVARRDDGVFAAATVAFPALDTAAIQCDLRDGDTIDSAVAHELVAAAFKHCRDNGILK